jgi:hypothetical protein
MTKLRDDVRGAFDQEQSALRDVGDARHRLVHNALAARDVPASRGLQLAAGIAAVLIAAIVIATFALVKAGTHSQIVPGATPSPKAVVSPTPMTKALNVPDSTPIITFKDPAKPDQVDGITWDGKLAGVLPHQPVGMGNPANNLFATQTEIRDRSGKLVAAGHFGAKFFTGTWADDEIHFCQTVPFDNPGASGLPTTLQIVDARVGGARDVARIGTLYNQTYMSVAACSVQFDRAVVYQSGGQGVGVAQLWVVQLSTGKILWTRTYDLNALPVAIVSSRDGQYIAESQAILTGNQATWTTTILAPDGASATARLASAVVTFCWDDSLAVVQSGGDPARIVTVLGDRTVWTGPANYLVTETRAQPDGSGLALWLQPINQASTASPPRSELYLIAADGRVLTQIHNIP